MVILLMFSRAGDGNDSLETFKAETVAGMLAAAVHSHTRATDLVSQGRAAEACSIAKRALQSFGEGMQVRRCSYLMSVFHHQHASSPKITNTTIKTASQYII